MADDVTTNEIVRVIEQLRKDIAKDFAQVRDEIREDRARFVTADRYDAESNANELRVDAIETRLTTAFRWAMGILSAVIVAQVLQWLQFKQAVKP